MNKQTNCAFYLGSHKHFRQTHPPITRHQRTYLDEHFQPGRGPLPTTASADAPDPSDPHLRWVDLEEDYQIVDEILAEEFLLRHLRDSEREDDDGSHLDVDQTRSVHLNVQRPSVDVEEVFAGRRRRGRVKLALRFRTLVADLGI